jgi:hypothetical protein
VKKPDSRTNAAYRRFMSRFDPLFVVMAGPAEGRVPAIHGLHCCRKDVDGRDKHGHDDRKSSDKP